MISGAVEAGADFAFHDFLGLAQLRFEHERLVVFYGESGSGKSTAIAQLLRTHPDFVSAGWRVVDEVRAPRDLAAVWKALRGGGHALVASHVAPIWFAPFRLLGKVRCFALDDHPEKIAHWLAARGIRSSATAVSRFCALYGANYIDAQIVLEHSDASDFDQALARFVSECRLERSHGNP